MNLLAIFPESIITSCDQCGGDGFDVIDVRDNITKKLHVSVKTCRKCVGSGSVEKLSRADNE